MNDIYIAVYGTLKKGNRLHNLLAETKPEFIKEITIKGELYTNYSYPALADGNDNVLCELYKINRLALARLDMLESKDVLYERKTIKVQHKRDFIDVFVYYYKDPDELKKFYFWKRIFPNKDGIVSF